MKASAPCSGEWDARVEKRKFLVPPSGLNPHATAMASRSVDLPVPFSPMMNVTQGWNSNVVRFRHTGRQYGYSLKEGTLSRRSEIPSK